MPFLLVNCRNPSYDAWVVVNKTECREHLATECGEDCLLSSLSFYQLGNLHTLLHSSIFLGSCLKWVYRQTGNFKSLPLYLHNKIYKTITGGHNAKVSAFLTCGIQCRNVKTEVESTEHSIADTTLTYFYSNNSAEAL